MKGQGLFKTMLGYQIELTGHRLSVVLQHQAALQVATSGSEEPITSILGYLTRCHMAQDHMNLQQQQNLKCRTSM
jgi:hypothetical protein